MVRADVLVRALLALVVSLAGGHGAVERTTAPGTHDRGFGVAIAAGPTPDVVAPAARSALLTATRHQPRLGVPRRGAALPFACVVPRRLDLFAPAVAYAPAATGHTPPTHCVTRSSGPRAPPSRSHA